MASPDPKILDLDDLVARLDAMRPGVTVVHCHGVFDLLHVGHIRYFREARALGDVLVVTLTPDEYVNKGPHRPAFSTALRAEALAALDCVDLVAVNRWPTAVETIARVRPDIYVKGPDYRDMDADVTGGIKAEAEAVEAAGGRMHFTGDVTFSSTNLINTHLAPFAPEVSDYLRAYARRHGIEATHACLDRAGELSVLVVGETIIDEYHYCETLGKSGKEPILAAKFLSADTFAGGILAVANTVAGYAGRTEVLTVLGEADSREDFVRAGLDPRVRAHFIRQKNAPTICKRRYLESYPLQKLFEVYEMDGEESPEISAELCACLEELLPSFDVVVVADYGHGMLDAAAVDILCRKAWFLAVNAQVNAGNFGFNTIAKYSRADLICISERELRLWARSRNRDMEDLVRKAAEAFHCGCILITQGKQGCLCYGRDEGFVRVPAFTRHVVDRVGAGDAVLSVASLCLAGGAPVEMAGMVGNCVGAQAVATVSNQRSVDKVSLKKHIASLLK